ncbi:hypothetical protein DCAR_0726993 [Daucus carota subsp. sativus]|uniref:Bifunctional inhibitor/plant lipid transfer protein/seed storage helical domain-containing protein n=1 Tax=Daucus carota subsp. sativus TaxID=79200 RepID=A0AAF0XJG5_DAUCS|nr:hypothetical protein DCAR_0726993 [Daucus carota subsp. sativus]
MKSYTKFAILLSVFIAAMSLAPITINGLNTESFCGATAEDLSSCKLSVRAINPLPPSTACCAAVSNADMQCMCAFKTSLGMEPNRAMHLPVKYCNIFQSLDC